MIKKICHSGFTSSHMKRSSQLVVGIPVEVPNIYDIYSLYGGEHVVGI